MKKQRILFVCHGNICRSPMAEFMLKHFVKEAGRKDEFDIDSAATSSEELGNDMYPPAQRCLRIHGIPYQHRSARQMTRADYQDYDQIFVMDQNNLRWLHARGIEDPDGKIRMVMSLVGKNRDVADPWYTGDFEKTFHDLQEALPKLLD
ncbi:MAG TPA: low molecular weight phosphotyrosine protein phosphatase [Prevotella sp.]|nr:low molecular weight phosphotyrosine protein phosphatase [Prevotella sp.]HCN53821.1 low molecular weight phosphotyrosine protein phosphatase [Prevotella sp.]